MDKLDHPWSFLRSRKSELKFHVNSVTTFRDMVIWKFCTFTLERLFLPPKFMFLGVWPQTLFFVIETPKRHFLGWNHVIWAIKHHGRSSGLTHDKNTKKGRTRWRDELGIGRTHAFNPILTIFGMWGVPVFQFSMTPLNCLTWWNCFENLGICYIIQFMTMTNFLSKFPNFRCLGNKRQLAVNFSDIVKFCNLYNPLFDATFLSLSFILPEF